MRAALLDYLDRRGRADLYLVSSSLSPLPRTAPAMSQTKFEKAVSIVQSLPKEGPIQPTQDEQLHVRPPYTRRNLARARC